MDLELVLMVVGAVSFVLLPVQVILVCLLPISSRRHDFRLKQNPQDVQSARNSFSIWSRVLGGVVLAPAVLQGVRYALFLAAGNEQALPWLSGRIGSAGLVTLIMTVLMTVAAIGCLLRSVSAVVIASLLTVLMLLSLGVQGYPVAKANPTWFGLMTLLAFSGFFVSWIALGSAGLELSARRVRRKRAPSTTTDEQPLAFVQTQANEGACEGSQSDETTNLRTSNRSSSMKRNLSEKKTQTTSAPAETIRFQHHCGKVVKAPLSMSGRLCECPRCGEMLRVPHSAGK